MRKFLLLAAIGLFALQAQSQEIPEYCLENDVVHRYLTEVQYDPNNYNYSEITNYCYKYPWDWDGEGKGVRLDFPKPVTLKLTSALPAAGKLYVGESEDYSDADLLVMDVAQGADSINVYNLIPGRTYNWKLEYDDNGVMTVAQSGRFKTTGTLRMLKIDNVFNVRDMGGWPAMNGYPMKYGKIVRGSRLNVNKSTTLMITDAGIQELRRVGMRSELDMRDASNSVNATHAFFGEDCPILNVNAAYNSRIATFANGPQSIQGINQLIAWLKAGKPVYLHCSVGADRTGTVAYLVGALCGMTEDALCKEFELTSFSGDKIDNEAVKNPKNNQERYERLVRQRDYTGRLDDNDNNNSYKFADMVDKIKKNYPGETLQEKVYYHLKTGVSGTKVPEADLDWLINYLVGPLQINSATTLNLSSGETSQINAQIVNFREGLPNPVITYTSDNANVATVSQTGVITGVRGGTTNINVELDGFVHTITVVVEKVESELPASVVYDNKGYLLKGSNIIKNGSFEYEDSLNGWKNASGSALSVDNFSLKQYDGSSDRYIESKADGDDTSANSISMSWRINAGKSYVFGYKVKNSTAIQTTNNENLKVLLLKSGGSLTLEGSPSYDGNWTDVQYVFTNSDRYSKLQMLFTHLSDGSNNTCLDNFYLVEVEYSAGVGPVRYDTTDGNIYDLNGRKVGQAVDGIIIKDGKKVLIK